MCHSVSFDARFPRVSTVWTLGGYISRGLMPECQSSIAIMLFAGYKHVEGFQTQDGWYEDGWEEEIICLDLGSTALPDALRNIRLTVRFAQRRLRTAD